MLVYCLYTKMFNGTPANFCTVSLIIWWKYIACTRVLTFVYSYTSPDTWWKENNKLEWKKCFFREV